ncbi:hypothetical protein QBC42DRAFT_281008 [Cladorrhinum samala]|uniref:Uncharacterized protein n=1 Tax=Cladorrhinum samala TaxID=585594 RepID=A0AAV9HAH9_9PEZI|nr:hypothetical protein QBC42DRAFT_281008 [Cladorrhinum samala]
MEVTIPLHPKSGELRPMRNPPGFTGTREKALEYDPDDYTVVNVYVDTVQYGKYSGHASVALIILRFTVRFRPGNKRLRSFHIDIEFSRLHGEEDNNDMDPAPKVLALAPEDCRGKLFTEERDISTSLGLGLAAPLGGPSLEANAGIERSSTVFKEHEMRLSGWKRSGSLSSSSSSAAAVVDNFAVWDCVEAKKVAKGVLPNFRAAMIVQYPENKRFQAILKLDVERGLWDSKSRLFDWAGLFGKKEADDPLIFDPTQPIGASLIEGNDFTGINLEELTSFQPIPTLPSGYN